MSIEDKDHARAAEVQARLGRPVTPDDVAAHLRGELDTDQTEPAAPVETAVDTAVAADTAAEPQPARRRGRPPRAAVAPEPETEE